MKREPGKRPYGPLGRCRGRYDSYPVIRSGGISGKPEVSLFPLIPKMEGPGRGRFKHEQELITEIEAYRSELRAMSPEEFQTLCEQEQEKERQERQAKAERDEQERRPDANADESA